MRVRDKNRGLCIRVSDRIKWGEKRRWIEREARYNIHSQIQSGKTRIKSEIRRDFTVLPECTSHFTPICVCCGIFLCEDLIIECNASLQCAKLHHTTPHYTTLQYNRLNLKWRWHDSDITHSPFGSDEDCNRLNGCVQSLHTYLLVKCHCCHHIHRRGY